MQTRTQKYTYVYTNTCAFMCTYTVIHSHLLQKKRRSPKWKANDKLTKKWIKAWGWWWRMDLGNDESEWWSGGREWLMIDLPGWKSIKIFWRNWKSWKIKNKKGGLAIKTWMAGIYPRSCCRGGTNVVLPDNTSFMNGWAVNWNIILIKSVIINTHAHASKSIV